MVENLRMKSNYFYTRSGSVGNSEGRGFGGKRRGLQRGEEVEYKKKETGKGGGGGGGCKVKFCYT